MILKFLCKIGVHVYQGFKGPGPINAEGASLTFNGSTYCMDCGKILKEDYAVWNPKTGFNDVTKEVWDAHPDNRPADVYPANRCAK